MSSNDANESSPATGENQETSPPTMDNPPVTVNEERDILPGDVGQDNNGDIEKTDQADNLKENETEGSDNDDGTDAEESTRTEDIPIMSLDEGLNNTIYSKANMANVLNSPENVTSAPAMLPLEYTTNEQKAEQYGKIYGRLKKIEEKKEEGALGDPVVPENLYEALQSNFLKTMARTYLYRLVLTGTHSENIDTLIEWFKDMIEDINVHCYSEIITGVLVLYPHHFIHVLEGSEDTLMRFIVTAADQLEPTGLDWKLEFRPGRGVKVREPILFTSVKTTVLGVFRIKHRGILSGWKAERAIPTPMSEKDIIPGGFREKLFQFTKSCCIMGVALYKLTPLRYGRGDSKEDGDIEGGKEKFEEAKRRRAHSMAKIVPKTPFIDYIIKKDDKRKIQLRNLREHIDFFWRIPPIINAQQTDWPIPGQIAPYD